MVKDATVISIEDAIARLPDGPNIHTFRNPSAGMMLYADWDREKLIAAMKAAPVIICTGPLASAVNHGIALHDNAGCLFIETKTL